MRALRKTHDGPGLELCEIPEPTPGFAEVKIRVLRTGLCGTDLHLLGWDDWARTQFTPPMTTGHEFYGEIVELGPGVPEGEGRDELKVGQRVSVEGHIVCGRCRNCRSGRRQMCIRSRGIGVNRDGAFADYVVVPHTNVWKQNDAIDPDLGALFDPFGNAVHTCQQVDMSGVDVLITGAGPIGVMATAIARHSGARYVVVTDLNDDRLAMAKNVGADRVVNVGKETLRDTMNELDIYEGFEVGIEMSGAPAALNMMVDHCNFGGTIAMLGLPKNEFAIDFSKVITHMLTIKGVYGREMFETWYRAAFMLQSSEAMRDAVRSVITHHYKAEDWQEAFDTAASGQAGKVLISWED
ncbi:L-threonine 3-dehydrogenase [Boudabousia liubingyangii]|uniref:L-threonine 3-dehydrogenase n=1 Tax=Boudabousia liubingyangii TaxID=1921764 RepID=A0A1Q5PKB8_9ACTO|nr:L-threonine 3-dehydrogenase [Boudabousia liubingyangii]OKL46663.1 L-threonine 3-dehydrogenase [Boudabousia liubingyangii]OKL46751.1 L-threonine 3-dehydrogenase [Boudabousia liubingyangii]